MTATGRALFATAIGPCGLAWGPGGIVAVQLPEQHGAGAAIALGAAFLGAGPAQIIAQMVEQGVGRIAFDLDHVAVEKEANHRGVPAAIQAPSRCRSAGVIWVGLPIGMTCVSTVTALIRAAAARTCS